MKLAVTRNHEFPVSVQESLCPLVVSTYGEMYEQIDE